MSAPILELKDVSLSFGGIAALRNVSFTVQPGEVFSVIGPNGAGKTTIFNIISRLYTPQKGDVRFKGESLLAEPAHRIAALGVGRTFQNIELLETSTVVENLLIGREVHRKTMLASELLFMPSVVAQEADFRAAVDRVIDFLQLGASRDRMIGELPYGIRKIVEFGRALATEPSLILLDEPSSGLNTRDKEIVAGWISEIRARLGITVVLVEHDMNLVETVSDRVLVLEAGQVLVEGTPKAVQTDPAVIRAYLGE